MAEEEAAVEECLWWLVDIVGAVLEYISKNAINKKKVWFKRSEKRRYEQAIRLDLGKGDTPKKKMDVRYEQSMAPWERTCKAGWD